MNIPDPPHWLSIMGAADPASLWCGSGSRCRCGLGQFYVKLTIFSLRFYIFFRAFARTSFMPASSNPARFSSPGCVLWRTCCGMPSAALKVSNFHCCGSGIFYPGSEFFPSRILDPGSKRFPDPGRIRIRIKEFTYFNPKNCFLALGNMIYILFL